MHSDPIIYYIFMIFVGAAILATFALYARLSLLVVYIILGIILGPSTLNLVTDPQLIKDIAHIGIIFLLFLLGINLQPQKLIQLLQQTTLVTGLSSVIFFIIGFVIALLFKFNPIETIIIGLAMMFSSTIIGLKLLPTTALHHQHIGEIIISVLLLQDIIAVFILILLAADWSLISPGMEVIKLMLSFIGVISFAYFFERYILIYLIRRFDRIQEYIFLMAIGWCMGIAELASLVGLSSEIGAFIAGIVLATNPIALHISQSLKPLRDFFLIIFFVALGASFDLSIIEEVLIPALILSFILLLVKPYAFKKLLSFSGEKINTAAEVGVRLGQISEFSIFIAVLALELEVIGAKASYLIQVCTLFTFIFSSWFIVIRYPTPIAVSEKLRRD